MTGLLNVAAMGLTFWRVLGTEDSKLSVPLPEISVFGSLAMLLAVLLTAMLLGGIMLVASTLARSFRDANNLLSPVLFIALSPGIFGMLPRSELTAQWAAVLIANCVLLTGIINRLEDKPRLRRHFPRSPTVCYIHRRKAFNDEMLIFPGSARGLPIVFWSPPQPGIAPAITLVAIVFRNYYGGLLVSSWSVGGIVANQVVPTFSRSFFYGCVVTRHPRPPRMKPSKSGYAALSGFWSAVELG